MAPLSRREKIEAIVFYAATSLATILWWGLLLANPQSRTPFLGADFADRWLWVLFSPDILSALVMSTVMVWAIVRSHCIAPALAWVHFGAQGYAWVISLGLAVIDSRAYWGVVAMTLSTGPALAFAIRIQGSNILWGAFQFAYREQRTPKEYWTRALKQTFWMWTIFLLLIPAGIALSERALGWDRHWITDNWRFAVAAVLFTLGGSIGLWAGKMMADTGDGTPLPSECTRKLVLSGPYRFIRNPMAMGGTLQGIMVGLAWGSPLIMLYAFIGGVWWEVLVRRLEEAHLEATFGDEYRAYLAQVRCWWIGRSRRMLGFIGHGAAVESQDLPLSV
ncbi:MAG: isoprenylcysteine carboxylmethyltransferase family protein [Fimbriimonadaceae bacterium]|nr:isoprenylcysteine carboxylmethyltransferase family protein [Fimbriimonadaceae bacterium]